MACVSLNQLLFLLNMLLYIPSARALNTTSSTSDLTPPTTFAMTPGAPSSIRPAVGGPGPEASMGISGPTSSGTGCAAYLNAKDGCISPDQKNNCRPKVSTVAVQQFALNDPIGSTSSPSVPTNIGKAQPPAGLSTAANSSPPLTQAVPKLSNSALGTSKLAVEDSSKLLRRRQLNIQGTGAPANITSGTAYPLPSITILSPNNVSGLSPQPNTIPITATPNASNSTGTGSICGPYDGELEIGACLWSGSDPQGSDKGASGWISSVATDNCKKEILFQRVGSSAPPVVARVLEGCNFETSVPSIGCFQIYLTKKAFMALNPSPEEAATGVLKDSIVWDFNSKTNQSNLAV